MMARMHLYVSVFREQLAYAVSFPFTLMGPDLELSVLPGVICSSPGIRAPSFHDFQVTSASTSPKRLASTGWALEAHSVGKEGSSNGVADAEAETQSAQPPMGELTHLKRP